MTPAADSLAAALLHLLAAVPAGQAVSVPRLGKQLQQGASAVMRELSMLGSARIGDHQGPGWVAMAHDGDRWMAQLTDAGRDAVQTLAAEPPAPSLPPPVVTCRVQRLRRGPGAEADAAPAVPPEDDRIAAEVPVALVFNGISHAVMMATPADLEAFALGFALSEGILDAPADCFGIEVQPVAAPPAADDPEAPAVEVHLEIASRCFARLKERRRALVGRTGCGVCGIDSLDALDLVPEALPAGAALAGLEAATVLAAFDALSARQPLNAQVGSLHAAGWALPDGTLAAVLEDVGRHNALDKLFGQLAADGLLGTPGFVVMSSRASYELARKCARLGVPALATISAPTALAVRIAGQAGMQLWGLCRGDRAVRYAAAEDRVPSGGGFGPMTGPTPT